MEIKNVVLAVFSITSHSVLHNAVLNQTVCALLCALIDRNEFFLYLYVLHKQMHESLSPSYSVLENILCRLLSLVLIVLKIYL